MTRLDLVIGYLRGRRAAREARCPACRQPIGRHDRTVEIDGRAYHRRCAVFHRGADM